MDGDATRWERERGRTPEGDLDPLQISADLENHGRRYAEANAEAKLLEESKAVMRATLIQHYRAAGKTRADAEDLAVMDPDYNAHLETMVEARRIANNAKACWMAAQARLDAMRTVEATKRAEMQSFRGR